MKKTRFIFIFLIAALFGAHYFLTHIYSIYGNMIAPINLGGNVFYAELVSSQKKLERGLGGRTKLCDSCGMLFEFNKIGTKSFWMKNMLIPLDIVWILDGKIVHLEKNVQPSFGGIFTPAEIADTVLELNAGKIDKLQIGVGDKIELD